MDDGGDITRYHPTANVDTCIYVVRTPLLNEPITRRLIWWRCNTILPTLAKVFDEPSPELSNEFDPHQSSFSSAEYALIRSRTTSPPPIKYADSTSSSGTAAALSPSTHSRCTSAHTSA